MLLTIKVKPAPELRPAFANWAIVQSPRVDTCSHVDFCVPHDLFTLVPEELLIGAIVDGHRYRSPLEDEWQAATVLERVGAAGELLHRLPPKVYPPGATPLEPAEPAQAEPEPAQEPVEKAQSAPEVPHVAASESASAAPELVQEPAKASPAPEVKASARRTPAVAAGRRKTSPKNR
ncbi:hypothetical protein [Streptomyces sp. AGS-58]|uniref:hypothetical protein n=1 Tax=unclassified Streptomyces TaxID=2593676 RepID=UPI0035A2C59F